jgi:hypothetical protein
MEGDMLNPDETTFIERRFKTLVFEAAALDGDDAEQAYRRIGQLFAVLKETHDYRASIWLDEMLFELSDYADTFYVVDDDGGDYYTDGGAARGQYDAWNVAHHWISFGKALQSPIRGMKLGQCC